MASSSAVPSSVSAAAAVAVAAAVLLLLLVAVGAEAETRKYQFDVSLFALVQLTRLDRSHASTTF